MASTESLAGGGRTTRTPRIVLAIGIAYAAAVGIAAVTVGAAGGKSDARRAPVVYELVVSRAGQSGAELRTEWISPSTREWRIEEEGRVKIYSNGRYAVVDPQVGTSVRRGSPQVMGYLTRLAVTAEPLDFYLSDGEAATSRRTPTSGTRRARRARRVSASTGTASHFGRFWCAGCRSPLRARDGSSRFRRATCSPP